MKKYVELLDLFARVVIILLSLVLCIRVLMISTELWRHVLVLVSTPVTIYSLLKRRPGKKPCESPKRKIKKMQAKYKNQIVEVWEIGKDTPKPSWVEDALQKNYIVWLDNHVRILMAGLQSSLATNLKIGLVGTAGGGFAGYSMYVLGYPGDYLDLTNHRVVSAKAFHREYQVL